MKSYTPPMKRPRKALQLRVFSGVKCSQPTPGISAYSRAASAALRHGHRPGSSTATVRPGEMPCRTPGRAGFPPRPPRLATFPARDQVAAPQSGNSGNKRPSSTCPAYRAGAVQRQAAIVFIVVGAPFYHQLADRRLFLPGQFTAHFCPLSLTEAAPGSTTRSRSRASRDSHRSGSLWAAGWAGRP